MYGTDLEKFGAGHCSLEFVLQCLEPPYLLPMAQKAAKRTASRNREILNKTHFTALGVHLFYFVLRLVLSSSLSKTSVLLYFIFTAPSLAIELLFEINSRPRNASSSSNSPRPGEDLSAPGLTEWMWDVTYWTWGCIVMVALVGDWAWFLYVSNEKNKQRNPSSSTLTAVDNRPQSRCTRSG